MIVKHGNRRTGADTCARCGACLSFCPVYQAFPIERYSPRGKNYLLRSSNIWKRQLLVRQTVSACLQCGACSRLCTSGTDVARLIREERGSSIYFRSLPHSLFQIWKRLGQGPRRATAAAAAAGVLSKKRDQSLQGLGGSRKPFVSNTHHYAEMFPGSRSRCLIDSQARRQRIFFFTGCIQNFVFPEVAARIASVLNWDVTVAVGQECCGLPAFSQGALNLAAAFAEKNLHLMEAERPDIILTGCASCAYMMRSWPRLFEAESQTGRLARVMAKRVVEFSQFVESFHTRTLGLHEGRTAVQVPCHQRYGIASAGSVWNVARKFVPRGSLLSTPLGCCGLGGSFSLTNKKLSKIIFEREITSNIERFTSKERTAVVTTCSGCLLRLEEGLTGTSSPARGTAVSCHLVDLMVDCL